MSTIYLYRSNEKKTSAQEQMAQSEQRDLLTARSLTGSKRRYYGLSMEQNMSQASKTLPPPLNAVPSMCPHGCKLSYFKRREVTKYDITSHTAIYTSSTHPSHIAISFLPFIYSSCPLAIVHNSHILPNHLRPSAQQVLKSPFPTLSPPHTSPPIEHNPILEVIP